MTPPPAKPSRRRLCAPAACTALAAATLAGNSGCEAVGTAMAVDGAAGAAVAVAGATVEVTAAALELTGEAIYNVVTLGQANKEDEQRELTLDEGRELVKKIQQDPNRINTLSDREKRFLAKVVAVVDKNEREDRRR